MELYEDILENKWTKNKIKNSQHYS